MKLTENFSKSEFNCKDGSPVPDKYLENVKNLSRELQFLRDTLNYFYVGSSYEYNGLKYKVEEVSIIITSAYRTPKHNKKEGGSESSRHLQALAGDFKVYLHLKDKKFKIQLDASLVSNMVKDFIAEGLMISGGVGYYDTFTHYDIRGEFITWDYRSK